MLRTSCGRIPRLSLPLLIVGLVFTATVLPGQGEKTTEPQAKPLSLLSLRIAPVVELPLGNSSSVFGFGAGAVLGIDYRLPPLPLAFISADVGYGYETVNGIPTTLSLISPEIGIGLRMDPTPWLSGRFAFSAGYFYSFLSDSAASGGDPFVSGRAGLSLLRGPLRLTTEVAYRYLLGLEYSGLSASVGLAYELEPKAPDLPERLIEPEGLSFSEVFPVFRTYYAAHPLGKIVIRNSSNVTLSNIKVSFQVKQFMTDPTECPAPAQLAPGESKPVDLFGLFLPSILEVTERTKAQAIIKVEYVANGKLRVQDIVQPISILDRNATTWADDRRAAAFVTTKDPAVLYFSKNVNSVVVDAEKGDLNENFLTAMAFFDALQLFGLTYSKDPIPTAIDDVQVADYIQFPRQTLEYKGGKCSDFSVLYSALLESVGIETAFITVPGHIFVAFSTGLSSADSRRAFVNKDDLILRSAKCWIPLEVTEDAGFLQAWQDGAKEWRDNSAIGDAAFYPLHEAWQAYEPVGLPNSALNMQLPALRDIAERFIGDKTKFALQEISPRVADLQERIQDAQDPRKLINDLGVLFARYGLYDRAKSEFERLVGGEDYIPALLNMGHIYHLANQNEKAMEYYNRAFQKDPNNIRVLLAIARALHDVGDYRQARALYSQLKTSSPDLASKYTYLDDQGAEATRAARVGGSGGAVIWEE